MISEMVNIKNQLKQAKVTQKDLAEILKVSPVAVHWVVIGKKRTPRIRKAIALAIGKNVDEIDWPPYRPSTKLTEDKAA